MLNWPGRKSKPAAGSISSVQMSAPSRRTRATRSMAGSIGSATAPTWPGMAAGISARCAVDIEHLETGGLEPLDEDRHEAHHHGVAEIVIALEFLAQTLG